MQQPTSIPKLFLLPLLVFLLTTATAVAQTKQHPANLKAVFIYNFISYIEWENEDAETEFIIGILGNSTIDKPIAEIAKTNLAKNKRIVIKHFNSPEDIGDCRILYIPKSNSFPIRSVLEKINKGTLTVSDEPGLARQGTAFNFLVQNEKLKFEASLKALYLSGLKVSSQLLKLAIIVD